MSSTMHLEAQERSQIDLKDIYTHLHSWLAFWADAPTSDGVHAQTLNLTATGKILA